MHNLPIIIAGKEIAPGEKVVLSLPASLYTQTQMDIPIHVFHSKKAGPKIFVLGGIHGDELNSVEIIRRLHSLALLKELHGTLITIPVVNVYGFIMQSRYLPDRRDLNRSFPGSKSGSLAARLANALIEEIVSKCHYGIDLHTGAYFRCNLPQIRVNLETPGAEDLARAFDIPIILDAKLRDGSLRQAASELGIPLLVYEGGEALRYNEIAIRVGLRGVVNVLRTLEMLPLVKHRKTYSPVVAHSSTWVRANSSGLIQALVPLSRAVEQAEKLAYIHDPFGINESCSIVAPESGIIIGKNNLPLVNEGDALFHIACFDDLDHVSAQVNEIQLEIAGGFKSTQV